jgi:hypothetical protein
VFVAAQVADGFDFELSEQLVVVLGQPSQR